MRIRNAALAVMAVALGAVAGAETIKLTAYERSQGWRLLFDGESLSDWRGFHQNKLPANWHATEGSLVGDGGTALVSTDDFKDFEITFDWKVAAGGEASVYFRAVDDGGDVGTCGPVMQLAGDGVEMAGNGGLNHPWRQITLQPDVWYRASISVFGYQVAYSINGDRIMSYVIGSPDWKAAVAASRFKDAKEYGLLESGAIVLAGKEVSFRNIRVRGL
ncbi:MAG TPA: DUF1080 domain-containing protein [Lacunisphaera sp.]|nr:DUF1080 domain-containing protein [Lacunisphaera sp.]